MKVQIIGLKVSYGDRPVLDVPELTFPRGKVTTVIGPNGAGKSTLLKAIGALIPKEEGQIFYGELGEEPPFSRMTLVFQEPMLFRGSILDNMAYPLKLRGVSKKERTQRGTELAEELGLMELLQKQAGETSYGEAQKVSLARALSFEPQLLLLDEPCASIDPNTTMEIEEILKRWNQEKGTTLILVTHNLAQARRMADQVVFLDGGRPVEVGTNPEFFQCPKTDRAKRMIAFEQI